MIKDQKKSALTIISGDNFSGRSSHLRSIIDSEHGIFIGEQPSSSITGIFPTVLSEIKLHSHSSDAEVLKFVDSLFKQFNFHTNFDKNPFTLSGGEQTVLAVLSGLLLQPKKLAIDCTIEQLNKAWREPLLNTILKGSFSKTDILLADNRINEYGLTNVHEIKSVISSEEYKYNFAKPCITENLKSSVASTTIDLSGINFYYNKRHPILLNLSTQLIPGEIYHLKGINGAGKSTLAKILTGILKPHSGEFLVNKVKYNAFNYPGQLVGYNFQNPDEQIFSSVIENEVLPFQKKETTDYKRRREIFLDFFGLQRIRKEHPAEMPFSVRKRISLASTLALDRSWYIFDEPTLGQDNEFSDFLNRLLIMLKELGKGIIIISHSEHFTDKLNAKKLTLLHQKLFNDLSL